MQNEITFRHSNENRFNKKQPNFDNAPKCFLLPLKTRSCYRWQVSHCIIWKRCEGARGKVRCPSRPEWGLVCWWCLYYSTGVKLDHFVSLSNAPFCLLPKKSVQIRHPIKQLSETKRGKRTRELTPPFPVLWPQCQGDFLDVATPIKFVNDGHFE